MTTSFPIRETFIQRELKRRQNESVGAVEIQWQEAEAPRAEGSEKAASKNFWLVSREFDLIFICGIAPWVVGLLVFALTSFQTATDASRFAQQIFTTFFVAASLIVGESHQFTSIIRYFKKFRRSKRRTRLQRITMWVMYVFAAEIAAAVLIPNAVDFLSLSFMIWTPIVQIAVAIFPAVLFHHVCAQANAIVQIYCQGSGYKLDFKEKMLLSFTMWCTVGMGVSSVANPFASASIVLSDFLAPFTTCSAVAVLLVILSVLTRGARHQQWPPLPAVLLWINLCLYSFLPQFWDGMVFVWLFVPLIFHATQHWAVAWATQKRESNALVLDGKAPKISHELFKLVAPVLVTTMAVLFLPNYLRTLTWLPLPSPFRMMFSGQTLNVFLSMFVFYMHYFTDRMVWQKSEEGK